MPPRFHPDAVWELEETFAQSTSSTSGTVSNLPDTATIPQDTVPQAPPSPLECLNNDDRTTYSSLLNCALQYGLGKPVDLDPAEYLCAVCKMPIGDNEVILKHVKCAMQVHAACALPWPRENDTCLYCQRVMSMNIPDARYVVTAISFTVAGMVLDLNFGNRPELDGDFDPLSTAQRLSDEFEADVEQRQGQPDDEASEMWWRRALENGSVTLRGADATSIPVDSTESHAATPDPRDGAQGV